MIERSVIFLDRVRLYAYHGVMPQEQQVGGWFQVSLRVACDVERAVSTDCVDDTVSYAVLLDLMKREMQQPSRLLEHVAGRVGQAVMEACPQVSELWVTVVKENPPMGACCEGAGVELHLINDKT